MGSCGSPPLLLLCLSPCNTRWLDFGTVAEWKTPPLAYVSSMNREHFLQMFSCWIVPFVFDLSSSEIIFIEFLVCPVWKWLVLTSWMPCLLFLLLPDVPFCLFKLPPLSMLAQAVPFVFEVRGHVKVRLKFIIEVIYNKTMYKYDYCY